MPSLPRSTAALATALFLCLLALFTATADRGDANRDSYSAGVGGWTIATTGTPWLDEVAANEFDHDYAWVGINSDNGREVITRSPGVLAAAVPGYWIAERAGIDGFSVTPQALSAAMLSAGAVVLLFLALAAQLTRPVALLAAAAVALTTPIWSISADALWTHTLTVLGIWGMAWAASRERWLLVGLFGGIGIWGRLHVALIVAAVGLGVALIRRRPDVALRVGAPSLALLGGASLWSHWVYGSRMPSGAYSVTTDRVSEGYGTDTWGTVANQLGLWVSPDRGFVVWTPVLVVLLPALVRGWREVPDWARILPFAGLAYTLIQGQLNTFTGGDGFFAYRHTLELLACVVPCFAFTAHHLGHWARRLVGPFLGLQFAFISVGAFSEGWYVVFAEAWRDSSFLLLLRHEPLVTAWVALAVLIGGLAGQVWRDRHPPATEPLDRLHRVDRESVTR